MIISIKILPNGYVSRKEAKMLMLKPHRSVLQQFHKALSDTNRSKLTLMLHMDQGTIAEVTVALQLNQGVIQRKCCIIFRWWPFLLLFWPSKKVKKKVQLLCNFHQIRDLKLAAIDIGSNAARLLITEVTDEGGDKPQFNKINLIRVPLRLGFDVFEKGEISQHKQDMIMQTMKAYKLLLNVYEIQHLKACATSAMRDAANGQEIITDVKAETGIDIKIITGDEEAAYIYENHIAENLDKEHSYLYIDVGGGSTELTFFSDGSLKYRESFNIGTIRLLKGQVDEKAWDEMKDHLKTNTKSALPMIAIGSGGNINKVYSLSKRKEGKPLTLEMLRDYYKEFSSFSLEERMRLYKLREDRADVIVPALQIYIAVMRWADISEIYVPKIGLADGLVQSLYEEVMRDRS